MSFLVLLEAHLHFPDSHSLKTKRKEVSSLKSQLHRRFGASVAETEHHDLWQRATLSVALVGREAGPLRARADELERFVESRFPESASFTRTLVSRDELLGE